MIRSLYIAATGMTAQQSNVDTIANNLANVNTNSFKRTMINFEDLMYQDVVLSGANSSDAGTTLPSGMQIGLGSRVASMAKSFEQGPLMSTPGVPLNLAFDGVGFFQITLPNGDTAYTRDGSLQVDQNGNLVTSMGYQVSPAITFPDNGSGTTVSPDGIVQVTVNSQIQNLGQIQVARFINPSGLKAIGNNMYIETQASGSPVTGFATQDGFGTLKQNFLENSNVNSVYELTELIKAQRAFEFNSKLVQTSEQLLKTIIDTKA